MGSPTLDHEDFALRLYALRTAGKNELKEWQPRWGRLPYWPLVWSLRRVGLMESAPGPARLARIWQRWSQHHRASLRYSRHQCCKALVNALTREEKLVWLLLLLEGHRNQAVDPLLELLGQGDEDARQLAAIGLAEMGRQILPDLQLRWRSARSLERQAICQSLWYLGSHAHGCLDWLQSFQHPWARAVYFAMEEKGWPALLALGDAPIWLDCHSLESVARLVFSIQPAERSRALVALRGWGPSQAKARQLLEVLARDSMGAIAQGALVDLLEQPGPIGPDTLQYALLQAGGKVRSAALKHLFGAAPENGQFAQQRGLIRTLNFWSPGWTEQLLDHLEIHGLPDPDSAHRLLPLDSVKAIRAYLRLEGEVEPLLKLARQGPIDTARFIFKRLLQDHNWSGVSACLERAELLDIFLHQDILSEVLQRREFDQVSQLVLTLRNLAQTSRPPQSDGCKSALEALDVTHLDWPEWNGLNSEQKERKLRIMEWNRTLPEAIVAIILQ